MKCTLSYELLRIFMESPKKNMSAGRYTRYVYDVPANVQDGPSDTQDTPTGLNYLLLSMHFTLARKTNRQLQFLHLTLAINNSNKLTYKIYRKPTQIEHLIPATSSH